MASEANSIAEASRYPGGLILLHWLMAIGIIGLLVSGLVMTNDILDQSTQYKVFQTHKAFGVLMLVAFAVRLAVRLTSAVPALPFSQPKIEAAATKFGHVALYVMMFAMVGSGWLMVSSSPYGLPTSVFGWFNFPHMPGISANAALSKTAKIIHEFSAFALIALILGHLAAIVKHRLFERVNILPRMWWAKRALLWIGGSGLAIGLIALALSSVSDIQTKQGIGAGTAAGSSTVADGQTPNRAEYVVDYPKSVMSFSGEHAGDRFEGVFESWQANIIFDPNALAESEITASISLISARTGDSIYDGTLPEADWFDAANYAQAKFTSRTISALDEGKFQVDGVLSLKGVEAPVGFVMSLSDIETSPVLAKANFKLDRFAFGIGAGSDPDAEWVSKYIDIQLEIVANRP